MDSHGSVTDLVNHLGESQKSYAYNPYGKEKLFGITPSGEQTILYYWQKETDGTHNPFRYCGEYYDEESGLIYLRNRYYDPTTGRFITEDPARDGLNWYVYCGGNPVMYVDPWGLEYIVVSGGEYKKERSGDYNYEFIEPAIKKIREWRSSNKKESIMWIIADEGWSNNEREQFRDVAKKNNVGIKFISGKSQLIDYINNKNGNGRQDDKITRFAVFSHGLSDNEGTISLGYNYDKSYNKKLNISKVDIRNISANAFDSPNVAFYSCNLGTSGEKSFAQNWVNKLGGEVWAFAKKSNFADINDGASLRIKFSRWKNGFSYYGSANYPVVGNGATFSKYVAR